MLPKYYRFTIYNDTGQTLPSGSVQIKQIAYKYDLNGALSYESSGPTVYMLDTTCADNGFDTDALRVVTNTSNLYLGGHFMVEASGVASSAGNVEVYFEGSNDNALFPTSGDASLVTSLYFGTNGWKRTMFEV